MDKNTLEEKLRNLKEQDRTSFAPIPVYLEDLAEQLGIGFIPFSDSDYPGENGSLVVSFSLKDNSVPEYTIFYNEDMSEGRCRFTKAHEIGHFILHREQLEAEARKTNDEDVDLERVINVKIDRKGQNKLETEANKFAAELLMPEAKVKEEYNNLTGLDKDFADSILANKFKVSLTAMSIRLEELGLKAKK